eukprot:TRINITY_DN1684_c0_g1::TRINITY_DN1684_c0_g1_i1::g.17740::m.17740 TRINITY_DN1684_c0_g1::TRINITY_DN1684_c0_g1_i1::g.17740  ORF type:complete len:472 (+),score=76.46,DUF4334/PF14232.1/0.0011,NKAIN/PF05640.9/0.21 TRINITY_DN1684_c0_g1_i1:50-1417(+)
MAPLCCGPLKTLFCTIAFLFIVYQTATKSSYHHHERYHTVILPVAVYDLLGYMFTPLWLTFAHIMTFCPAMLDITYEVRQTVESGHLDALKSALITPNHQAAFDAHDILQLFDSLPGAEAIHMNNHFSADLIFTDSSIAMLDRYLLAPLRSIGIFWGNRCYDENRCDPCTVYYDRHDDTPAVTLPVPVFGDGKLTQYPLRGKSQASIVYESIPYFDHFRVLSDGSNGSPLVLLGMGVARTRIVAFFTVRPITEFNILSDTDSDLKATTTTSSDLASSPAAASCPFAHLHKVEGSKTKCPFAHLSEDLPVSKEDPAAISCPFANMHAAVLEQADEDAASSGGCPFAHLHKSEGGKKCPFAHISDSDMPEVDKKPSTCPFAAKLAEKKAENEVEKEAGGCPFAHFHSKMADKMADTESEGEKAEKPGCPFSKFTSSFFTDTKPAAADDHPSNEKSEL